MSIIETAYGEQVAARLCTAIQRLDEATRAYQTTGDAQTAAQHNRDNVRDSLARLEADRRAAWLADPALGKNAEQRAANLIVHLAKTPLLAQMRAILNEKQWSLDEAERLHKNASHQMLSLRAAINGYAAVLDATKD